jgi:SAM-dependent methyltransferase
MLPVCDTATVRFSLCFVEAIPLAFRAYVEVIVFADSGDAQHLPDLRQQGAHAGLEPRRPIYCRRLRRARRQAARAAPDSARPRALRPAKDQDACGLVQLRNSVPPRILYRSYFYRSGINQSMRDHLAGIARFGDDTVKLQSGDLVLDIGCNDGTLLKSYQPTGIKRLGIDPSNMVEHARAAGLQVVNDFFSAAALRSAYPEQKPRVITSIAMFYDLENPHNFVADIKASLNETGVWILELSYLPLMLQMNSFDTICHEHLEYYSLAPMERLFAEHDLEVVDVTLNDCNGGSFRIAVGHRGKITPSNDARDRVQKLRLDEFELALDTDLPYAAFRKNIEKIRKDLRAFLVKAKKQKKLVHGYGASTKGNTTLQYIGATPDLVPAVADRNPDKLVRAQSGRTFRSFRKKSRARKNRIIIWYCRGISSANSKSAKLIS